MTSKDLYQANLEKFSQLYSLYEEYNSHTNISAIRNKDEVVEKHFLDSLQVLKHLNFDAGTKVLDLGSGGGFPVLPLAIVLPGIEFTALDATAKKTKFISQVKDALALDNLKVLTGRAEDFAHEAVHREQYDFLLARAVAQLNILLELGTAFIKPGSAMLAYKAKAIEEEKQASISTQKQCSLIFETSFDVSPEKQIMLFRKQDSVSDSIPRQFSQIKANPF